MELTFIYEDYESQAIEEAYELVCAYRKEIGEDIDNFDFNRFVLMSIIDSGLNAGRALRELLP